MFPEWPARFAELQDELDRLQGLSEGWDSYGAPPPNENSIEEATKILTLYEHLNLIPARIVPSSEGGVAIVLVRADKYADVECLNDGDVLAATYQGDEEPDVWQVIQPEATVKRIRQHFEG